MERIGDERILEVTRGTVWQRDRNVADTQLAQCEKDCQAIREQERRAIGELLKKKATIDRCDPDTEPYYIDFYWIEEEDFKEIVEALCEGKRPEGVVVKEGKEE